MTALADLERARAAHTDRNGTVVITRPAMRWPFITAPGSKDPTVTEPPVRDRSAAWLRSAMIALGALAVAAATVSYSAQFVMVDTARKITAISALEAGIPDASALIFACLGIALALQGKRAVRARLLNLGAVATSVFMNYAAAGHGWRDLAIWIMPPVAYALASDTAIGVVRAWALARQKQLSEALAEDESTPLVIVGRMVLYSLRFALAPVSTARGARRALLLATPLPELQSAECPAILGTTGDDSTVLVPQDRAIVTGPARSGKPRTRKPKRSGPTKTDRLLTLAAERHDLAAVPLDEVSSIATGIAGEVDLHPGTARRVLLGHVRELQSGGAS